MAGQHTNRGKWSQAGVPHKGWSCTGIEDLGEPAATCEMCEAVEIRYVHHMEHPDFPEMLGVGCVCAEHMEDDYVGPREREATLKKASRRRVTWAKRTWSLSLRGTVYLNTEGFNLQVYHASGSPSGWRIAVVNRVTSRRQEGRKIYASPEDAKRAALDALLWAKDRLK
jgi:hypothetical protein